MYGCSMVTVPGDEIICRDSVSRDKNMQMIPAVD